MSTKILLVDDHQLIREGLCSLVEKEFGIKVVGQASDGNTAVRMAKELCPDIIIMDISMPGLDGIEATKQIKQDGGSAKIIALSMHTNKLFVMNIFEAGAMGYLLKECASSELITAINSVMENNVYISPKVANIVIDQHAQSPTVNSSKVMLTEKEYEVLRLLAGGQTTKQISVQFKKSVQSIDGIRRQIMEKLGCDNMVQLIKYAIREGLTTLD
jgi:DNA-binding NarL/FixJ family response regulator